MNLLYALESVRTPFWDAVFSAVTHLGEETVFMVAAILIFWCVSKQEGYYLLLMGFFGTVVNQFLKLLFRIPRPWVRDPDFTIVESARAQATGYSFPVSYTHLVPGRKPGAGGIPDGAALLPAAGRGGAAGGGRNGGPHPGGQQRDPGAADGKRPGLRHHRDGVRGAAGPP